jgi:hypothetical protein
VRTGDDRKILQALSLINDCNKYKMDLTTNGVIITDAIKFVQTNKEKITMSTMEDKESKEPEYNDAKESSGTKARRRNWRNRSERHDKPGFLV